MDACRICTLIFDVDPLELGRAKSDTTICCICEVNAMYIIEPKRITTMTAVITEGRKANHETRCIENPDRAIEE